MRGNLSIVGHRRAWSLFSGATLLILGSALLLALQCPPTGTQAPVAADQSVSTAFQTALAIVLGATDADSEAADLTFSIVAGPANGTLSAVDGDDVTYTPDENFSGADSFTFKANDGVNDSNTATVSITVAEAPPGTITEDTTLSSLTVAEGETITILNGAEVTVTGDAQIDGEVTATNGLLVVYLLGDATINGTLSSVDPSVTDLPDDSPLSDQPVGIYIIAGDGEVTFGEDVILNTNGNVVVTDDDSILDSTPGEFFDEVEDVSADELDTLVPLPPDDPAFDEAAKPIVSKPYNRNQQGGGALPPININGVWPPAGAAAPPGDRPVLIFRFFGNRTLNLGNWTVNGPAAPNGSDKDETANAGDNSSGSNGKNGMRLNIWNNGGPINITNNVVLNLADGGDGGSATSVCAAATGGDGGNSGNFRMTAAGGIDLTNGTLTINPGDAGDGGDATANKGAAGADGCPGEDGDDSTATGGDGGDNKKRIYARGNVVGLANLTIGNLLAGDGGEATATACDGGNGLVCCDGGPGGAAEATGGDGGDASLSIGSLPINTGFVFGGDGGDATATGGDGGDGGDCKFLDAGDGGAGGAATATGGAGGSGTGPGGSGLGGDGGDGTATGGDGGDGGDSGFGDPGDGGAGGSGTTTAGAAGAGDDAGTAGEEDPNDGNDGNDGGVMVVRLFCFPLAFLVNADGTLEAGTYQGLVVDEDDATQLGFLSVDFPDIPGAELASSDDLVDHIGLGNGARMEIPVSSLELIDGTADLIGGLRIYPLDAEGLSAENLLVIEALDADGEVIGTESFSSLPDNSLTPASPEYVEALFDVEVSVATFRITTPPTAFVKIIRICLLDP